MTIGFTDGAGHGQRVLLRSAGGAAQRRSRKLLAQSDPIKAADGSVLTAQASLENRPGFSVRRLGLPDSKDAVKAALAGDEHTMSFITDRSTATARRFWC
jgi:hypothetical protein